VLFDVWAAGVGNWDEFVRAGDSDVGRAPPMALGVEAAGVVAAVGRRVADWGPGDEVTTHPLPLRRQGCWAPVLVAPGALLVNGAAGVTGALIVSLGAERGAVVIATASPSNHRRLSALGADHPIDYHDDDWREQVQELAGGAGVACAANAVPGGAAAVISTVRDGGRLATITSDPPDEERGIVVSSVYVRPDGAQLRTLSELLAGRRLEITVGSTLGIDDAGAALAMATHGRGGRAVVLVL
jgi:NADPH:quinone reductase-like Zn-dependent oxidoreductase